MLTAAKIKEKARSLGADLVGIGDIALYEGSDPQRDPRLILPAAKCVIGMGFRVPRGLYELMHSKTQYYNYMTLGVKYQDEERAEIALLKMAAMIEDEGYDACVQRNVSNLRVKGDKSQNPEVFDTYELQFAEPVEPGKPAPDIIMDFAKSAEICGLGKAGLSGAVLTPKFGPYVRFVFIVTDAPLDVDPPFTADLCDGCGACVTACPGHAISEEGTDSWQCSVYYRGAHRSNPFMNDAFLVEEPDREAILNGEKRFDAESARAIYPKLKFLPNFSGYVPCLCGKACDYACYKHLKEVGKLD